MDLSPNMAVLDAAPEPEYHRPMTDARDHWETVWSAKSPEEVSWFQPEPTTSLTLIDSLALHKNDPIVDVGGGASLLVDRLVERGYAQIAVVDISDAALDQAAKRLGAAGDDVTFVVADVRKWWLVLPGVFKLWHDRAVFHFLITDEDQQAYVKALENALAADGFVILATFALDGPEKCSGLPVVRHDAASLSDILGANFRLIEDRFEEHKTPGGTVQKFQWCVFQRV